MTRVGKRGEMSDGCEFGDIQGKVGARQQAQAKRSHRTITCRVLEKSTRKKKSCLCAK